MNEREQFVSAWTAAAHGDHRTFQKLKQGLERYELYPYLVYEDFRHRRAQLAPEEMASFLEQYPDWAFADGLRLAWLKTLGEQGRWQALIQYGVGLTDTKLRCLRARALIETGQEGELLREAQSLWTVGKSQPRECDPLFEWLQDNGGITPALAWARIRLAMLDGNPRFTLYLARFVPPPERVWLERWQDQARTRYRRLDQSRLWPDREITRMITAVSLQRLAQQDADQAWRVFAQLDGHFGWSENTRGVMVREIALQAAVALSGDALQIMSALPKTLRDDQLLQWWARLALVAEEWATLDAVIARLPEESRSDGRWRYWQAFAREKLGDASAALKIREALSRESTYYGFLAADRLERPYTICPLEPSISPRSVARLRSQPDFSRSLELRAAGLENWAVAEWSLAVGRLDAEGLRAAAALAQAEGWSDRAIFALGNSGDRQFYAWRFPLLWEREVAAESARNQLDPAWVHGVMRSESALAETARSPAGAIGLMQITPATAKRLARKHGLAYNGREQLRTAGSNIRFGTRFMRELLDRYNQNPVLVSAAFNAGPKAVDRWLESRPRGDAAVWIDSIPYFETRDYIPRVLAFTAIYEWRMQQLVTRLSSRMPDLDSTTTMPWETTQVICTERGVQSE